MGVQDLLGSLIAGTDQSDISQGNRLRHTGTAGPFDALAAQR